MEKRHKKITVRFTAEELEKAKKNAEGALAVWLRNLALNQKPKRIAKPVNQVLLFELNKIGVNLNQIARSANGAGAEGIEMAKLLLILANISDELEQLRAYYDS